MKERLIKIIQWVRKFAREKFHYKNEEFPYYVTILPAFIVFVAGLNAFIELTEELAEDNLAQYDTYVINLIHSYRSDGVTSFFVFITNLGDRFGYLGITLLVAAYFFIKHRSWTFITQTVLVLLLSTFSNMVLKLWINRARPMLEHLVTVNTLSYPSGHAMSAMGFYGFLIYLSLRYRFSLWLKIPLVSVMSFLVISIGISRIYLGVHYPSDVLAGFIGGLIWVTFCVVVFNIIDLLRKRKARSEVVLKNSAE